MNHLVSHSSQWFVMDEVKVSDLVLTDEHKVVGMDTSISEAASELLSLGRGILVVLGDDSKVKGIVTPNQILEAVSGGGDGDGTVGEHMDADVMEVALDEDIDEVIVSMNSRKPHAVVAVDKSGAFAGYFSPNDYREALARVDSRPAIRRLSEHE